MGNSIRLAAVLAASILVATGADTGARAEDNRAMIILDASGSMWGQIGGEAKITIARRVLSEVLETSPQSLQLGLMAYGHRQKGRCDDIELLARPESGLAEDIAEMAQGLKPKGKTPLSDAVRKAADVLRYQEQKATVILITDGLETCRADPCEVGRSLNAAGVDFTTHIVGFGLSAEEGRQVACLAENTGGRYLPAQDAASLGDALSETVTETAALRPAEPEPVPDVLPQGSVTGPQSVEIGRPFVAHWDGPGERWDRIALFDPKAGNGEGRELTGRRIRNADFDRRQVRLVAPVRPGAYILQYRFGSRGDVIATAPIEIVDAAVSLDAPANVGLGETFIVGWNGPGGRHDRIQIIDPLADGQSSVVGGKRLHNDDLDNRKVTLIAPAKPGFYRLQYWSGPDRTELASRQIEILETEVGISAPDSVAMGMDFSVRWQGPGARRDRIDIVDPQADGGKGKAIGGKRLVNDDFDNNRVTLIAPAKPGTYRLQYYNGDSRLVLATRPLVVEALSVSLEAPASVEMGHTVGVTWSGPGARRDRIEIWDATARAGQGHVVAARRVVSGDMDARRVELIVPVKPGDYVLRYWNGDSNTVLAERPLAVDPVEVTLSGPPSAEAGTQVEIGWQGPGGGRDVVQFFDPGDGKVHSSKRLTSGDYDNRKVVVKAPKPGTYLLRYWNGDYSTVLAERPITVQ